VRFRTRLGRGGTAEATAERKLDHRARRGIIPPPGRARRLADLGDPRGGLAPHEGGAAPGRLEATGRWVQPGPTAPRARCGRSPAAEVSASLTGWRNLIHKSRLSNDLAVERRREKNARPLNRKARETRCLAKCGAF